MTTTVTHRILRNYRNLPPTKFHVLNQRVSTALADKTRFPEWVWTSNTTLLPTYLAAAEKHGVLYHESLLGSKLVIAEREVLHEQLIIYLDEIASILELAVVKFPDILLASGFDLAKERRSPSRPKPTAAAHETHAGQGEGESGT